MVRAPGLHPGCCRFDPYPENQEGWQSPAYRTALEMRQTLKSLSGSNPLPSANLEEWPSGLRRRFAKPLGANNASQVRILLLPPIYGEMAEPGLLRRIGSAVGPQKSHWFKSSPFRQFHRLHGTIE